MLGPRKVAKHFSLTITDQTLTFARDEAAIAKEAALDGSAPAPGLDPGVVRSSVPAATLEAAATVSAYKSLAQVEGAFRSLKTVDLEVRPIHHRLAGRVRAHLFLCTLAYHLIWHLRRALAPLLFDGHDRAAAAAQRGSPVAAARRSPAARAKAQTTRTAAGQPVHSWRPLLQDLATLTRNTVRLGDASPLILLATPTALQPAIFERLGLALVP